MQPGRLPQIIRSNGFGFTSRDSAMTIGYFNLEAALLPAQDCRIVIWLDKDTPLNMIGELNANAKSVCLVGPGVQQQGERK